MSNEESCCLAKILKVIDILQKQQNNNDCFDESCTKPIFGPIVTNTCYNTRPITLYTKNGSLFTVNYNTTASSDSTAASTSSSFVFRVEEVCGCCAKLRILAINTTDATAATTGTTTYTKTNQFITVNLKCFCVVKCLADISLDGC